MSTHLSAFSKNFVFVRLHTEKTDLRFLKAPLSKTLLKISAFVKVPNDRFSVDVKSTVDWAV